jgi:phytanoyl-CoA hydroxylase
MAHTTGRVEKTRRKPAGTKILSEYQHEHWEQNGYLVLRGFIPPNTLAMVSAMFAIEANRRFEDLVRAQRLAPELRELKEEQRFAVAAARFPDVFGRGWRKVFGTSTVFHLYHTVDLVNVISQLTGTDVIGHPVFNGKPKLPGQELLAGAAWHQDSSYYGPDTQNSLIITCWMPLVPADATSGCLQVVRGSHRLGLVQHEFIDRGGQALWEVPRALIDQRLVVDCPMQRGDVLLMHNLLMHHSVPNNSETIRWSMDIRYIRAGDEPGQMNWYAPAAEWIIHSQTKPSTSLHEWTTWVDEVLDRGWDVHQTGRGIQAQAIGSNVRR